MKRLLLAVVMVLVFLSSGVTAAAAAGKATDVAIGVLPFLDYAPWVIGANKGWFQEAGLNASIVKFSMENEVVEALASGAIQVGAGSPDSGLFLYPQFPDLRVVNMGAAFTGFAIMGRPTVYLTYEQALKQGMAPAAAAAKVAGQLKGKQVITTAGSVFQIVLASAAKTGGYSLDDLKIVNMEPVEGAAAFISGVGDAYSDGLPSRWRLEQEGYPVLLPAEALGPGGICFSGAFSTRTFVTNHREELVKVMQVYYRIMAFLKSNPDEALDIMLAWLNKEAGAGMTVADGRKILKNYVQFPYSVDEATRRYYDPKSPLYYKKHYEFVLDFLYRTGQLPKNSVDLKKMFVVEQIDLQVRKGGQK